MGNPREATMWEWVEQDKPQRQRDYTTYLKAAVNVESFVDADSLDGFWRWCMDNQPKR